MSNIDKIPDVGVVYFDGTLLAEEISELKKYADENKLQLALKKNENRVYACLDIFVPAIQIFISSEFIANSLISGAIYDATKSIIMKIWSFVKQKNCFKVTNGKTSNSEPCIHIKAPNEGIEAIFPNTTDKAVVEHYIDRLFDYLSKAKTQRKYLIYNKDEDCFTEICESEIIKKYVHEKTKK